MAEPTTPAAPAEAPKAPESVADNPNNTNTNTTDGGATNPSSSNNSLDLQGFTPDQLKEMKTFFDNNGGFEKVKSKLSNPDKYSQPAQTQTNQNNTEPAQPVQQLAQQTQMPPRPQAGYKTPQDMAVENYFNNLSQKKEYEPIAEDIRSGEVIKQMNAMGMNPVDQYGNVNMEQVKSYLDLKVQTIHPPKSTSTEPNASPAPTVEYIPVENGKIDNLEQAYKILTQDTQQKKLGQPGHPNIKEAEDYIKASLSKKAA